MRALGFVFQHREFSADEHVFQRRANDELNVKRYCGLARNKDGDKCTINIRE